ncbi:glycosyltransferase family 2 protein [uncultured Pseudokineococcus sp.]|uniref:glycosyltransferase n=1 Tax=uncultured Pseudokineococcus sp. TaxID=1642928 RepID=UPI0026197249|nr:glycosyltransferase [uncultured Pseudokineococcus sp.]
MPERGAGVGGVERPRVRAVVVAVPVRDEEARVAACLRSVLAAAARAEVVVVVAVALDRCADASRARVDEVLGTGTGTGAVVVELGGPAPGRTVADVRDAAVGAGLAALPPVRSGDEDDPAAAGLHATEGAVWLACTDADTLVPEDWLAEQLRWAGRGADLVAGGLRLDDDPRLPPAARERYEELLHSRVRGETHEHVYGANLGVRASAWRAAGGFPRVATGEEAALLAAVERAGGAVVRPLEPRVTTSGRTRGRAAGGLADLLDSLAPASGS